MKHWELEYNDEYLRITWQRVCPPYEFTGKGITFDCKARSEFAFQMPIGGQWMDYHCFSCEDIEDEQEALEHAMEVLEEME